MTPQEAGCGEQWVCDPCDAVNFDIRKRCRFCGKPREEVARQALASTANPIGETRA
jgi:hypothetical protein